VDESVPANETVIAWSGNGPRFMLKTKWAKWRNMLDAPKPTPLAWMPKAAKPLWLREEGKS